MLYQSFKVVLWGLILGVVMSDPIDFSDCGSDYKIVGVDIEGCETIPCKLKIGNYYNITITIKPVYTSHSLSQEVYITLYNSVNVPVSVLPDNPCASLNCPVQVSDNTKFKASIFVGYNFVPAKGKLWWKMTAEYGRSAVCMKTTVMIEEKKYNFKFLRPNLPAI